MKTKNAPFFTLCLAATVALTSLVGCSGSSSVPVSGIATLDGKPLEGLRVTFFPEETKDNPAPGPYSTGVTDASGKYVLKNRDGKEGAMVWKFRVDLEYDDIDEEAMSDARSTAEEARSSGDKELASEAKKLLADAKAQLKKRPRIPTRYLEGADQFVIDIPAGGTDSANLEMTSKR